MNTHSLEEAVKKIATIIATPVKQTSVDEHIFFTIIRENKLAIGSEEYISAAYFHCHSIKALAELRNKNGHLADWYLSKVDLPELKVGAQMEMDMGIVYFPLIGYKAYTEGNYEQALADLNHSIDLINSKMSSSENVIPFLKAKIEQLTNVFRIHVAGKNLNEGIEVAICILQYLNSQERNALFYHDIDVHLEKEIYKTDWLELVNLYTDLILGRLLTLVQHKELDEYALFKALTKKLYKKGNGSWYNILYEYYNNNPTLFLQEFLSQPLTSIVAMPFSIQYLITSKVFGLYKNHRSTSVKLQWSNFLLLNDISNFSAGLASQDLLLQD